MKIGNFNLEKDGVFIVAELSANHAGDLQIALDTIKSAKEAGANAIKFQTYTADTITLKCEKEDFLIKAGSLWDDRYLHDLYEEAHTPWEWHAKLFDYARELGLEVFSTPFDRSAVDFLEQFSPCAYKIASFEITDCDLIRYIAQQQRPVIISTGIATIEEIQLAVEICRNEGNNKIILLKCTSSYPAPFEEMNLKMIPNLAETFGVISGLSDHTLGTTAPIVATTLGAKIIEKHLILDKKIGGPDASFSLDEKEFTQMVKSVRDVEKLLGCINYIMTTKKQISRSFSRSLYIAQDVQVGETFTSANVRSVRPGYSMHPKYLQSLLGKTAKRGYTLGDRISAEEIA